MSGEYVVCSNLSQESSTTSAGSANKRYVWRCPVGRRRTSNWKKFRIFLSRMLPLICPCGKSTCLNSMSDIAKVSRNNITKTSDTQYHLIWMLTIFILATGRFRFHIVVNNPLFTACDFAFEIWSFFMRLNRETSSNIFMVESWGLRT